jgi:hypothetical protein
MELKAKLIQLLPLQTGSGKNGPWKKQDVIVETEGTYPKKVCISIWGDKIDASQLQIGKMLTISFDIESREYNGRWYTDVKAWKIEGAGAATPGKQENSQEDFHNTTLTSDDDDLPF